MSEEYFNENDERSYDSPQIKSSPSPNLREDSKDSLSEKELNELAFSEVFGGMIETAVCEMNDIGIDYGQLSAITENSYESHGTSSFMK